MFSEGTCCEQWCLIVIELARDGLQWDNLLAVPSVYRVGSYSRMDTPDFPPLLRTFSILTIRNRYCSTWANATQCLYSASSGAALTVTEVPVPDLELR